jgi:hypothetical protein
VLSSATPADTAPGWASGLVWPRGARDEESWQPAVLAAELSASGAGEPPAEDELWECAPDPGGDPPGDAEADVPAQVRATWPAETAAPPPGRHPAATSAREGSGADRAPSDGTVPRVLDCPGPGVVLGGFGEGGALDALAPGAALAGFAAAAWDGGLERLSEDELVGVVRAWRRLSSWAAAGELAAVAELVARCDRGHDSGLRCQPVDCVAGELACALRLTRRGADGLVGRALQLAGQPATAAALRQGQIDMPKMLTIADGVAALDPRVARLVEDMVVAKAATQTNGELRAAVRRAVFAADPAAAQVRRESAEKNARVELWDEPAGTKALAGRDLPPADVLAADKRISAIARELKTAGAAGSLDVLRAKVYLALLAGQPLDHLLPTTHPTEPTTPADPADSAHADDAALEADPADTDSAEDADGTVGIDGLGGAADRGATHDTGPATSAPATSAPATSAPATSASDAPGPAGPVPALSPAPARAPAPGQAAGGPPGSFLGSLGSLAGSVNLTVPLVTLLGLAESPGEVAGFGPVDADTTRLLAGAAAQHRATGWCLTITGPTGRVIGHGCACRARAGPGHAARGDPDAATSPNLPSARGGPAGGTSTNLAITIDPLAFGFCAHDRETAGYQLTPRLRHLIEIRDKTCSFPGCRRPAICCDKDHTVPFDQGGKTCECNLAPLCRAHHQLKQAHGWRLTQPRPGVMQWTTPSGRTYTTGQP